MSFGIAARQEINPLGRPSTPAQTKPYLHLRNKQMAISLAVSECSTQRETKSFLYAFCSQSIIVYIYFTISRVNPHLFRL